MADLDFFYFSYCINSQTSVCDNSWIFYQDHFFIVLCLSFLLPSIVAVEYKTMKISDIIKQELEKRDFRNLKSASKFLGISVEILRLTINKGHIPKDKTLIVMAEKLGLDKSLLILAAHREKVPSDVKDFFLPPSKLKNWREKRIYPLSEEQCDYLTKFMSADEIQMVRKFQQVSEEKKTQIIGYVEYMFATDRK